MVPTAATRRLADEAPSGAAPRDQLSAFQQRRLAECLDELAAAPSACDAAAALTLPGVAGVA